MATSNEEKQAKRDAVASMAGSAADCVACPLHATRTKVAFGVGNAASPLMLIGEGPGMNEDLRGEPFVGRAGELLDACLYEAGMKREHVYITNIVKCRASTVENGRVINRVPTPDELGVCVPLWLDKQIEVIKPRVIVCVGGPAASVIIHSEFRIMKERGTWFESRYADNVMAVLHPAFILRQEGFAYNTNRSLLVADLIAAKERAIAAKNAPPKTLF